MVHLYFGEGEKERRLRREQVWLLRAAGQGKRVIYARFMKGRSSGEIGEFQPDSRDNGAVRRFLRQIHLSDDGRRTAGGSGEE